MGSIPFKLLLLLNFFAYLWAQFNKITETNRIKTEAAQAFHAKNFSRAVVMYDSLIRYYRMEDERLRLNLAHALFKNNKRKQANEQYNLLATSPNPKIASIAYQQLGMLAVMKGKNDQALEYFIKALKTDPDNEKARYNFELLKKLNRRDPDVPLAQNKTAARQGNDRQGRREETGNYRSDKGSFSKGKGNPEKGGNLWDESAAGEERKQKNNIGKNSKNGEELKHDDKGNKEEDMIRIRLQEIHISEEKARFLLEEMKNSEVQYLQQVRIKQYNQEYKDKPDW